MCRLLFCPCVAVFNLVDPAAPDLDADSGAIIRSLVKMVTMRV